jgi:hypothetical protein
MAPLSIVCCCVVHYIIMHTIPPRSDCFEMYVFPRALHGSRPESCSMQRGPSTERRDRWRGVYVLCWLRLQDCPCSLYRRMSHREDRHRGPNIMYPLYTELDCFEQFCITNV